MSTAGLMEFGRNEIIFMEGDPGDCMYVVVKGRVKIQKRAGAEMITLADLGPGAIVGEMSLLDNQPRSATAKTLEPTNLAVITQEVLQSTYANLPAWFSAIFRVLTGRLRDTLARKYANDLATAYGPFLRKCVLYCKQNDTDSIPLQELKDAMTTMCNLRPEDAFKLAQGMVKLNMATIEEEDGHKVLQVVKISWLDAHYQYLFRSHYQKKSEAETLSDDAATLLQSIYNLAMEKGDKKARQTMIEEKVLLGYLNEYPQYKKMLNDQNLKELAAHDLLKKVSGGEAKTFYSLFPQNCEPIIAFHEVAPTIVGLDLAGQFT